MIVHNRIKPPDPIPATALKAIKVNISLDNPHPTDPIRKMTIADIQVYFLPNISLTLPYIGCITVDVSKNAIGTQDIRLIPSRLDTIVRNAVDIIVTSKAARKTVSVILKIIMRITPQI